MFKQREKDVAVAGQNSVRVDVIMWLLFGKNIERSSCVTMCEHNFTGWHVCSCTVAERRFYCIIQLFNRKVNLTHKFPLSIRHEALQISLGAFQLKIDLKTQPGFTLVQQILWYYFIAIVRPRAKLQNNKNKTASEEVKWLIHLLPLIRKAFREKHRMW